MNRFNIFRRLLALSCLCALLLSAPASMGTLSPETVAFQKKDPLFAQLGSRYRAALASSVRNSLSKVPGTQPPGVSEAPQTAGTPEDITPGVSEAPQTAGTPEDMTPLPCSGIEYNNHVVPFTSIGNFEDIAGGSDAWTDLIQSTIDSGALARCGNYFAGHNPGVLTFLSGITPGEVLTVRENGSSFDYIVTDIIDVWDDTMPDETFSAVRKETDAIALQFCMGDALRIVDALPLS